MASLLHSESRRLYSWWWDSHISPKNSKWLQENLTDMDAKVKSMIKLIEEDADSFAKRAEMYYKKRPELMKLVEEFYRAYRALAERYDHATGALRQAHCTMAEAFPNEVPFVLADDSPSGSSATDVPHTTETLHPLRAVLDPNDLHKDALGLSSSQFHAIRRNSAYSNESDSVINRKGLKQLNELFGSGERARHYVKSAEGKLRKDKNCSEHEMHNQLGDQSNDITKEKERSLQVGVSDLNPKIMSSSEQASKVETEVQILKETLARFEAEKEAGLLQYQHALEKLSNLDSEVSHAQEDARELNERASKAEIEVETLNQALTKLQAEKEAGLLQYQQCLGRMSYLETKISHVQEDTGLNERVIKAETEAQNLKQALARVEAEKNASLLQYNQCLEIISKLENNISRAQEDVRNLNERAVKAETEVQFLKEAIAKLNEEKESAALQYQRSLETIYNLESEISHAQEEATRLSSVIVMGVAKLSSTEEQYLQLGRENQSLQTEVDTLVQMMTIQKEELSEKHEELERLQNCIQAEYHRSMQAEAALQTLQNLRSESQEERRALALEVENGIQMLKDMELQHQGLEEAASHVKEENQILKEQNFSSAISIKNMQDEISRLRETEVKLEKEVEAHVNQRNALQQAIYCLKEELNDLKKRHLSVIEQVQLVGLKPDCLGSSLKGLQEENSRLKEISPKGTDEKVSLLKKLKNMENLSEKNARVDNSLSDVNARLDVLRGKVEALEETCQSLQRENSTLVNEKESLILQLEIATGNMEKLSEKSTLLENSLFDANVEVERFREQSKSLEEVFQSLDKEKSGLLSAKDGLVSQLISIQQKLDDLEKKYTDLEEKHRGLEKEKESKIHQIEELQGSLDLKKQEHESFILSSETQLSHLKDNFHALQQEAQRRTKEFEEEQDKAVKAQLDIFILQRCIRDMEEKNLCLFIESHKYLEASTFSEKLVTELERENLEQLAKLNSLLDQVAKLRLGICQIALSLGIDPDQGKIIEDTILLQHATGKIQDLESSLWKTQDEKQQLLFEKSVFLTLLGQLRFEAESIESERNALDRDLNFRTEELLILQSEKHGLLEMNEHLKLEVRARDQQERELKADMENQCIKLSSLKELYSVLQNEKSKLLEENRSVMKEFSDLKEENCVLEEENSILLLEAMALGYLSFIFKRFTTEKSVDLRDLIKDLDHLRGVNDGLVKEVRVMDERIEGVKTELVGACESLKDERASKFEDIEQLKERIHVVECENEGMRSELAAYLPAIVSLRDSITSLGDHVFTQTNNYAHGNQETEVPQLTSHQHDNICEELIENRSLVAADGLSDLLELQTRIKTIESSVVEQRTLIMQESVDMNTKLVDAKKEIQKFKEVEDESSSLKLHNTEPEFSEVGNETLVKDIPLDQVSHCSSYDRGIIPNAMSRRENSVRNEQMLELWETVEQGFELDLTFNHQQKLGGMPTEDYDDCLQIESVDRKNEYPSSELQSKELGVVSKRVMEVHQGGNKRKILERLASDSQKLMNLQVTVHDLKKKVEQFEKCRKPKDAEYNTVKRQLKEVEEAILQLLGINGKLTKKAEERLLAPNGKAAVELEKTGKGRRHRILEQARQESEKIGRLQMEVQRIQFVLLKLEDEFKTKGTDRKILLRDYLYGKEKSHPTIKRKKRLFFACVKPPT